MPRYFRRTRTTSKLRDQLLRELEREGEKLLKRMASDFTADLSKQLQATLQQQLPAVSGGGGGGASSASGGFNASTLFSTSSFTNMLGSVINYAVSRPRTSTRTAESSRSQAMDQQFRLSRAQQTAELGVQLGRGDRAS